MHEPEILHALRTLFLYILLGGGDLELVVEEILRVAALDHYIGRNGVIRVKPPELPSVASVSESSFSFFHI